MRLIAFLVGSLLLLPATASASSVFRGWGQVVNDAKWIAVGTIARKTDKGFIFALTEPLIGSPPAEQFVDSWVPGARDGTTILAWATSSEIGWCDQSRTGISESDWLASVRFTMQTFARFKSAASPSERVEVLRALIASGYEDALITVNTFWWDNPKTVDFRPLMPALIQTIRTAFSGISADLAAQILIPTARPEDVPDLLAILERPDPHFRQRMLARLDVMTSPHPPPMVLPAAAPELGRAIEQRRAWYKEHEYRWRGQRRKAAQ